MSEPTTAANLKLDLSQFSPVQGDALYESSPLTRALAPWSISRAKTAACPQHFIWKYVEKRQSDPGLDGSDTSSRVGSAMHSVYEHALAGLPLKKAREDAIREHKLVTADMVLFQELYAGVPWFLDKFHKLIRSYCLPDPSQGYHIQDLILRGVVGLEKNFSLNSEFDNARDYYNNAGMTFLRGVADIMLILQNGGCIILDHKSAQFASLKYYEEQMRAYTIAAFALDPNIQWVQAGIHFMALQEVKCMEPVRRSQLASEKRALHYFLNGQANAVLTEEIVVGNRCKWCEFKETCKKKRKALKKAAKAPESIL